MKAALSITLLLASGAWAQEAIEKASIATTISRLNASPTDSTLFTADFPDTALLSHPGVQAGRVVISKEPWGEATWFPVSSVDRFVIKSVRFVTLEVALVEGTDRSNDNAPVLFVMKKDGTAWRIAGFRRIADTIKTTP